MSETENGTPTNTFWTAVSNAADPTTYKPERNDHIVVAKLENSQGEPYYVLKQPETRAYLRLSESDYALWWQMNGDASLKQLLFYSLRRYRTLPIAHLNGLMVDLRNGRFLSDTPVNIYDQMETALVERAPSSRGQKIIDAFLNTEIALNGLDDFFAPFYNSVKGLFDFWGQLVLLAIIIIGGMLFGAIFWFQRFSLTAQGGWSIASFFIANLLVIFIHELAHGLTTKHFGRELNRGGFLLYWGMPAFFVDTRDIWLSPRKARVAVSWAGPHSGLVIGGLVGGILAGILSSGSDFATTFGATFLYQIGFIAYLSVFINLNPLLELDGYFIMMDWLDMPGLRDRAFQFWRNSLWQRWQEQKNPRTLWQSFNRTERIFTGYGAFSFVYSAYALAFSIYFWQTRIWPLMVTLWTDYDSWGKVLVLVITAVLVIPTIYYLIQFGWSRIQIGLEWLARRDLLSRPDVLALLIGLPLLAGLPAIWLASANLARADLLMDVVTWLVHLAAIMALAGVARQLPGSRFQWAIWALAAAPLGLTIAWLTADYTIWHDWLLVATGFAILATGIVSWYTVGPKWLTTSDQVIMIVMIIVGPLYYLGMNALVGSAGMMENGRWLITALLLGSIFFGLMFMAPLLINFRHSRFALPWVLIVLAILTIPWLQFFPQLHLAVAAIWLYAALLYLVLGALAQFERFETDAETVDAYDERTRLVDGYNQFLRALFRSYEAIFGGRRLIVIQQQMAALGALDPDATILQIAARAQQALLLAVDRLDDLAGTPFTQKAGQAAYDSLPWLHAETLARHVLSGIEWGSQLAQGFIQARDRRAQLIRHADIFAGFDEEGVQLTLSVARPWVGRAGVTIAHQGREADVFYLIEFGEVGIFHEGVQVGTLRPGGYFGTMALLDSGPYQFTYRALTKVTALAVDRDKFDPLLRADTTLANQVSSGAQERQLLREMPLFSSLSPQELAAIDKRLKHKNIAAGEIVVQQGDPRSHLFIVANGLVDVITHDENTGEDAVIGQLGAGEHFGEYALFADTPYQTTYRAAQDTELLLLDEAKFDELVAHSERMLHYVEQIGSGRLIATRRRLGPSALIS